MTESKEILTEWHRIFKEKTGQDLVIGDEELLKILTSQVVAAIIWKNGETTAISQSHILRLIDNMNRRAILGR